MAVTESFRGFILEQLEQAARGVRAKAMFGGVGIYAEDTFFALIANDVLYFKVDDQTRPKYSEMGMQPFRPFGEAGEAMKYYAVPISVMEDRDVLRLWVADAIAVGRRAAQTPLRSGRRPR